MAKFAKAPRSAVVRTSRETIALALSACAVTFALAYAVHSRQGIEQVAESSSAVEASNSGPAIRVTPTRDWTGHLADVASTPAGGPTEPMTSASLVVSPSELPPVTSVVRPVAKRPCEGATCAAKASAPLPVPPARPSPDSSRPPLVTAHAVAQERPWTDTINPLKHLPDTSTLKQPFVYVGDKVAGWFK